MGTKQKYMILCKLNTSLHECSSAQLPFANLFSKCVGADKHFHECINALVPFGKTVCSCVGAVTGKTLQKTILNTSNTSQTKQRLHSTSEYKNPGNFDSPPPLDGGYVIPHIPHRRGGIAFFAPLILDERGGNRFFYPPSTNR